MKPNEKKLWIRISYTEKISSIKMGASYLTTNRRQVFLLMTWQDHYLILAKSVVINNEISLYNKHHILSPSPVRQRCHSWCFLLIQVKEQDKRKVSSPRNNVWLIAIDLVVIKSCDVTPKDFFTVSFKRKSSIHMGK